MQQLSQWVSPHPSRVLLKLVMISKTALLLTKKHSHSCSITLLINLGVQRYISQF